MLRVPLKDIHISAQPRTFFDPEALESLAASIKLHGVLLPLIVTRRGKELHLVDGERRYRAAGLAGCVDVPVIVREVADEADKVIVQLVANLQRADLNPMEKARAFAAVEKESGMTRAQLSAKVGLSVATLSRLARMLELPVELQIKVETGEIAPAIAYELTHIEDEAQRNALAADAIQGKIGRDDIQQLRRRVHGKSGESTSATTKATLTLGKDCIVTIATPNLDLDRAQSVLDDAQARTRKARAQGISLPTFEKVLKEQAKQARPVQTGGK